MRQVLSQEGHTINALPPIDINGGANSDVFSMKDCSHVTIFVTTGVVAAASTITVEECDDFTPTNSTAIAFKLAKEITAGGDTLAALAAVAATGFAISTNNNCTYVIEVDAENLTTGYNNIRVVCSDPSASVIMSIVAVQTGLCYAGDTNRTQIA